MQNKYQEKFGYPVERSAGKVKSQMASWLQEFIGKSPSTTKPMRSYRPRAVVMASLV